MSLVLRALAATVITTAGATNACASTLRAIPLAPWASGEYQNEGRAISPDGQYVVRVNYSTNAVFTNGVNRPLRDGFFYDVASNVVIQPKPADAAYAVPSILTGIGYRTDPVSGQKQLILDGMEVLYDAGIYVPLQANWMTADGGVTWEAQRCWNIWTEGRNLPTANSLGAVTESDNFYTMQYNTNLSTTNWCATATKKATGTSDSQTDLSAAGKQGYYRISSL